MRIVERYSHLNGEEYLIVHHRDLYDEIVEVINSVDASRHKTKVSDEVRTRGQLFYNPTDLNKNFRDLFRLKHWEQSIYKYCVTTNYVIMKELIPL